MLVQPASSSWPPFPVPGIPAAHAPAGQARCSNRAGQTHHDSRCRHHSRFGCDQQSVRPINYRAPTLAPTLIQTPRARPRAGPLLRWQNAAPKPLLPSATPLTPEHPLRLTPGSSSDRLRCSAFFPRQAGCAANRRKTTRSMLRPGRSPCSKTAGSESAA